MTTIIDQFMWGYQSYFRIGIQTVVERALELVGAHLDPRVFLVGVADDPALARHPLCVEPERGPLQPHHLSAIGERANEIYERDPERKIFNTNAGLHESRQAWLRRRARGAAIAEAIESSGTMPGKRVLVSSAGKVNGFEVHTCVALDLGPLDALPILDGEDVDRFPAPSSFTRHLVNLALYEADVALERRQPGLEAIRRSAEDLVREAADDFCNGCMFRTRNFDLRHPFSALSDISARRYEGTAAGGRLLLVAPDHGGLEVVTKLLSRVDLTASRAVRKLLETTDESLALLVHDGGVYGLGRLREGVDSPDIFELTVIEHGTWELRHGPTTHLRVTYGHPSLPRPIFDAAGVMDSLDRVLAVGPRPGHLMAIITAATRARHGTTLVISVAASSEARRLSGQSTLVEPAVLTPGLLTHYARIDGAVLLDPAGVCHAFGVILDGQARGQGDPARGSRYNSALRYQSSVAAPTVVVIVSEDGDVDLVPPVRARIYRQDVVDAIALLRQAVQHEDAEQFSQAFEMLRQLSFYLTPEQCATVNELAAADRQRRMNSGLAIVWPKFVPAPELDDSYFLE